MPNVTIDVNEGEERQIRHLLNALRTPIQVSVLPTSKLLTPQFMEEFNSHLLAQHVFLGNPLFQDSFDAAFISSSIVAGYNVSRAPDGQRFWDVRINGRNLSLKSTKAKSLRDGKLHISKLTEAAWIQDCRTAKARYEHTLELFSRFCKEVHSIFQLRYFHRSTRYELIEIPVALFTSIQSVSMASFNAEGPSIKIPENKALPDFVLKLDRSDAKITIAHIQKKLCTVHAEWRLG